MRHNIEAVDRTSNELMRSNIAFDGKAMLSLSELDRFFL